MPGSEAMGNIRQMFHIQREIAQLIPHLRSVRKPVIAAVNGPAAGGGFARTADTAEAMTAFLDRRPPSFGSR